MAAQQKIEVAMVTGLCLDDTIDLGRLGQSLVLIVPC